MICNGLAVGSLGANPSLPSRRRRTLGTVASAGHVPVAGAAVLRPPPLWGGLVSTTSPNGLSRLGAQSRVDHNTVLICVHVAQQLSRSGSF